MKMPENMAYDHAILAAKEQGIGAILAFCNGVHTFAANIMAVRLQKRSNRRNDVRHYRLVHS